MSGERDLPRFHAIIPAGGAGTRLWPLSRRNRPKFLLDPTNAGRSLIQQTWDRLVPLTSADGIMIVTGEAHLADLDRQLPDLPARNALTEPSGRDSMAAIGLAAALIHERYGDSVVGSFAADHVIADAEGFRAAVEQAIVAANEGYVTTIGIAADEPSTAFGYIRAGTSLGLDEAPAALHVRSFTEKPDSATAKKYLESDEYLWNAGMFVMRTGVLLGHLSQQRPQLHAGLVRMARAWDSSERESVVAQVWPTLERIAIDHAIAEPVAAQGKVAVVPGAFGWDDVGDFASLRSLLPPNGSGLHVLGKGAQVQAQNSGGSVVSSKEGRLIALVDVPDVVVVDTPDALLVAKVQAAQNVKDIVGQIRDAGREDLL